MPLYLESGIDGDGPFNGAIQDWLEQGLVGLISGLILEAQGHGSLCKLPEGGAKAPTEVLGGDAHLLLADVEPLVLALRNANHLISFMPSQSALRY